MARKFITENPEKETYHLFSFMAGWEIQNGGLISNFFEDRYHVVSMDLAGHGKSDTTRENWTSEGYADDIKAVADDIQSSEIILVGHSMSGAYVLEAALKIPATKAIVLVDTLKIWAKFIRKSRLKKFCPPIALTLKTLWKTTFPNFCLQKKRLLR